MIRQSAVGDASVCLANLICARKLLRAGTLDLQLGLGVTYVQRRIELLEVLNSGLQFANREIGNLIKQDKLLHQQLQQILVDSTYLQLRHRILSIIGHL